MLLFEIDYFTEVPVYYIPLCKIEQRPLKRSSEIVMWDIFVWTVARLTLLCGQWEGRHCHVDSGWAVTFLYGRWAGRNISVPTVGGQGHFCTYSGWAGNLRGGDR